MQEQGTLAITARGDGSRWYGRVSIPEVAARAAGLVEGMRVSACCDGLAIVVRADDHGRIRFPPARGRLSPRHAFEAATATLGLRDTHLSQAQSQTDVLPGAIRIRVPAECVATDLRIAKRPRVEPPRSDAPRPWVREAAKASSTGAAAALATEANRAGRTVRALGIPEIVQLLVEAGMTVQQMGARFFRVDGASATAHDLVEIATRVTGATEQNRIVLIVQD